MHKNVFEAFEIVPPVVRQNARIDHGVLNDLHRGRSQVRFVRALVFSVVDVRKPRALEGRDVRGLDEKGRWLLPLHFQPVIGVVVRLGRVELVKRRPMTWKKNAPASQRRSTPTVATALRNRETRAVVVQRRARISVAVSVVFLVTSSVVSEVIVWRMRASSAS